MKKIVLFFITMNVCLAALSQSNQEIAIIPEPVKITKTSGSFTLPENIVIETVETTHLKQAVVFLQERLSIPTGYKVSVKENAPAAAIRLMLNKNKDEVL